MPQRRPVRLVVAVCALGLLITALAAWLTAQSDDKTEQRLLDTQTRQAAAVLSSAIAAAQQPLQAALDVQRTVSDADRQEAFTRQIGSEVGSDQYVSASLWRVAGQKVEQVAAVEQDPGLDPDGTGLRAFLDQAASTSTFVVRRVEVADQTRLAYALADPDTGLVVYAERAVPADRRSRVDRNSAFADLSYAIYLGPSTTTTDLTTTNVAPSTLPLTGRTSKTSVPFGDTVVTLTASPMRHLGSPLTEWLPVILLVGGILLTAASVLVVRRLQESRRRAEEDTATITELYRQVGNLYDEQRTLALRLQLAVLPRVTPTIPGIEIATEYVASAGSSDVGGDWYSVIALDDERFGFVLGDVSGHGIEAVAEMAHARFTLRAYLLDGSTPDEALDKCADQFDVLSDGHITTVLIGIGNARTGEVTVANAGHPPPVLKHGSTAALVPLTVGPPLGSGPYSYTPTSFTIPPGSTLVAYTDGLIERRGEALDMGLARLTRALGSAPEGPLDGLVPALLASMVDDTIADDIAVLAVRRVQTT